MWKRVKGFEDSYEVSSDGCVRTIDRICGKRPGLLKSKILKQFDSRGYRFVILSKNGSKKNCYVHRLVAQCFIPNPENKPQVNHKNGVKSDNVLTNLEWSTIQDNHLHSYRELNRHRPNQKGDRNTNSKLTRNQVNDIINRYKSKKSTAIQLAKEFSINKNYVYQLSNGKTWKTELENSLK